MKNDMLALSVMKAFNNLMLIGRAGSGKSEFIDFLKNLDIKTRVEKYHIGDFEEIDDFPWLYSMFKSEDIWEQLGRPRKLATRRGCVYVTVDYETYKFLTLKFNVEINAKLSHEPDFYNKKTLIIEYARGRSDAYKTAFTLFDKDILSRTAIFYLDNTFEESMRRNIIRSSDSDSKQTILNHRTPVEVMEYYYKTNDWHEITNNNKEGYLEIQGLKVPFVTVWNEPESHDFKVLEERYSSPLKKLWELYKTSYESRNEFKKI